jgi:transposase
VPYLSEEDVAVLKKWRRSNNRLLWSKAVTVLDSYQGASVASICNKLEKSHRRIERWIKAFCEKGLNGISSPTARSMSAEMLEGIKNKRDRIVEILHESPQLHGINRASWSLATISQAFQKLYGEPIGKTTISEYIRAERYSFRKAHRQLTSPDPDFREKLVVITKILSSLGEDEKFFSVDDFGPFSVKMRGGKAYTPKGTIRIVPQWQRSQGSLILTCALELSTNQMTHFYSERKITDEMIRLLEILLVQYSNQRCLYLSWDAASWHISAKLAKRVQEANATADISQG